MEIKVVVSLPRDAVSIPVVRHICAHSLRVLGVRADCVDDVAVALTEACANVLQHARDEDEYEVSAGVDHQCAIVEVIDRGGGFTPGFPLGPAGGLVLDGSGDGLEGLDGLDDLDGLEEHGRGIQIMRALMDNVQFEVIDGPRRGTRVRLEKQLEWEDGALLGQLGGLPGGPPAGRPGGLPAGDPASDPAGEGLGAD